MASSAPHRQLLRELIRSGRPRATNNRAPILAQMRDIISNEKISTTDLENTALFLKSQRIYKVLNTLLDRYNPLHDMTSEQHLKATANRVGLNMPVRGGDAGSS